MPMNRYAALSTEPEPVDLGPDGPKMWSNNLVAFYETDPERIADLLPRPLEPTEPLVRVNMARVDMPGMVEPLEAGTFSVACRHGDVHGYYDLLMLMSTESAVVGGRETFGEPKKIGRVSLERRGEGVGAEIVGVMQRKGVEIVEIRGTVAEVREPGPVAERFAFYYKFMLDPQGGAFDHDPTFVHVVVRRRTAWSSTSTVRSRCVTRCSTRSPTFRCGRSRASCSPRTTRRRSAPSWAPCPVIGCGRTVTSATTA